MPDRGQALSASARLLIALLFHCWPPHPEPSYVWMHERRISGPKTRCVERYASPPHIQAKRLRRGLHYHPTGGHDTWPVPRRIHPTEAVPIHGTPKKSARPPALRFEPPDLLILTQAGLAIWLGRQVLMFQVLTCNISVSKRTCIPCACSHPSLCV